MDATFELPSMLGRALRAGGDLLLPRLCLVCRGRNWGRQPVCLTCLRSLAKLRWMGWLPDEGGESTWLDQFMAPVASGPKTWSLFQMDGVVRDLVHALKYSDYAQCAPFLIDQLRWANSAFSELRADCIVPVPLHSARHRERGFNQSRRLAKPLSVALGISLAPSRTLIRRHFTLSQTHFGKQERVKNIESAFVCRAQNQVQGRKILLVDDVCTTGSTLSACSDALLAAGAASVIAFTVAWMPKISPENKKKGPGEVPEPNNHLP